MGRTSKKSYLGFPCAQCQQPVTALTILADMETPAFKPGRRVSLVCRSCHHEDEYLLSQIVRFEEDQVH